MGYHLCDLYSITSNDNHEYFLFLVGDHEWDDKSKWIIENFNSIAAALEGKSVIVRGIVPKFSNEVLERYKSNIETFLFETYDPDKHQDLRWQFDDALWEYVRDLDKYSGDSLWDFFPLLIITNQNPSIPISEQRDIVFYLVPIGKLPGVREAQELVLAIVQGTRLDDFTRLEQILANRFPKSISLDAIEMINQSVELKPNFFGLGINLNGLIHLFTQRRRQHP